MDGRGLSVFAATLLLGLTGCVPNLFTVPSEVKRPAPPEELPEPPEPWSLNPFAKTKREPKLEFDLAIYCEKKALSLRENPEQQHRELDEARRIYQEILNYDNKYLEAYRGLGRVYVAQKDFGRAAATYRKAIELYPKSAQLYEDMSVVFSMRGDSAGAIQWLGRALEMDPENREFMKRLAVNYVQAGQVDRAVDMMSRARGRAAGHYFVARTLARMNRADEARQQAQLALDFNPNYADARTLVADLDRGRAPQPNPAPDVNLQFVSDE